MLVVDAEAYAREKRAVDPVACLHSDYLWVPRILFEWTHRQISLDVQRRQFPLHLAYAVTFNKSQGKTFSWAVVDIRNQPFAHGQLYVALSRVRQNTDIRILCSPKSVQNLGMVHVFIVATNVVELRALMQAIPAHLGQQFVEEYPVPGVPAWAA